MAVLSGNLLLCQHRAGHFYLYEYIPRTEYHGVNPQTDGAQAVSYFWGLMTAGCLVGMLLLKLIDSKRLLQISGVLTIVLLLSALSWKQRNCFDCFPCRRIQHFNDVLHRVLFGLEFRLTTSWLLCRYFMFRNRRRSRRSDDCQHDSRCYVAENRYVVYPGLCRIHHVHRLLGSPVD